MINYAQAKIAFKEYLANFDTTDNKIKLKLIHTFGVVKASEYLAKHLNLSTEQVELAKIIGLLHDIGRFTQLQQYHSFDDRLIDHAKLGIQLLETDNLLRQFVPDPQYDSIIISAIANHSLFSINSHNLDNQHIMFAQIIRDADKLDNYRVKATESIETLLDISIEKLVQQNISSTVLSAFQNHQLVRREDRTTKLDMWFSYLAFQFDLNYPQSACFISEHNYLKNNFERIIPTDKITYLKFIEMYTIAQNHLNEMLLLAN